MIRIETAAELLAWRKKLGLRQTDAALALGLAPRTYCRWELGQGPIERPRMLSAAATALETGVFPLDDHPAGDDAAQDEGDEPEVPRVHRGDSAAVLTQLARSTAALLEATRAMIEGAVRSPPVLLREKRNPAERAPPIVTRPLAEPEPVNDGIALEFAPGEQEEYLADEEDLDEEDLDEDVLDEGAADPRHGSVYAMLAAQLDEMDNSPEAIAEREEGQWVQRAQVFLAHRMWRDDWGPRPGQDGCLCPVEYLQRQRRG